MNTSSTAMNEHAATRQETLSAEISPARRMYWLIRRELWENRSIYLAPVAVAVLFLFGFLISTGHLRESMHTALALPPMKQHEKIAQPYNFAALLLMGATLLVGIFYCLDALYGERRDRSILFWKSLPVSDLTTVLSKASIPLLILPLLTVAITFVVQWIMLLASSVVLMGDRASLSALWTHLPLFQMSGMMLYHMVGIHALWYAPMWGWLLLVSSWARRAPFLWASLPLFAIGMVEKIAFNTTHFAALLESRIGGGPEATAMPGSAPYAVDVMTHFTLVHFLLSPGLWIGLVITAAFLAAAVRLRRSHGPI